MPLTFTESLYKFIDIVFDLHNPGVNQNLQRKEGVFYVGNNKHQLFSVSKSSLGLQSRAIEGKLTRNKSNSESNIDLTQVAAFLKVLNTSITGLNHCGVGYKCQSLAEETEKYRKLVSESPYHLYNEASNITNVRWLFAGNRDDENSTLFEIVLKQSRDLRKDNWYPHFQIDFDTSLAATELAQLCTEYFGKDFINFTLNISNYGTVMMMGHLGEARGTNIYIGLGTNLRNSEEYRKYDLQQI